MSPTPTQTPFPSSTPLAWVYDNFDDACIAKGRWYPGDSDPTPIIRGDCYDFGPPDKLRHLTELNSGLHIPLVEDADEGLISYWPTCAAKEIQLVIPSYAFAGVSNAWLGLVVPNPSEGQGPIGLWISSRFVSGTAVTKLITTRNWAGSQTSSTAQDVTSGLPEDLEIVLGIRFTGTAAYLAVGGLPSNNLPPIEALGYPTYFAIVYSVGPGSELSAEVDEIRVVPLAQTSKCRLPSITPRPGTPEPPTITPSQVSPSPAPPTIETPTPEVTQTTPSPTPATTQPPEPTGWLAVLMFVVDTVAVLLRSPLQCVLSAAIIMLLILVTFLGRREAKLQPKGGKRSMAGRSSSPSPWASGSFYLVALVVIALTLIVAAKTVPAWAIPLVFLAMILLLTIIGAFVLKSMPGFSNKSFLKLMGMVFTQVPLILGRRRDAGKNQDGGQGDNQPDS